MFSRRDMFDGEKSKVVMSPSLPDIPSQDKRKVTLIN